MFYRYMHKPGGVLFSILCEALCDLCETLPGMSEGYTEFHRDHTELHRVNDHSTATLFSETLSNLNTHRPFAALP